MPPGGQPTGCLGGSADLAERERVVGRRRIFTARRTQAAQGLNVCRAGFAGRGTARARSTNATRSRPFRPETRVSGRLIDADDRHAQPVRGPADVEAHRHALAQAVDPWDGAQDLHERELEVVLAAARVAHQRAALAAVVHALDGAESGTLVSDASGREYHFKFPFVQILGPIPRVDGLREGMPVGFDVGWTLRGLRVTVIRVY